jgi:hypothetical protein
LEVSETVGSSKIQPVDSNIFMSRGSPHNSLSIRVSEWQVSIPWKSSESFAIVLISLIGFSIL